MGKLNRREILATLGLVSMSFASHRTMALELSKEETLALPNEWPPQSKLSNCCVRAVAEHDPTALWQKLFPHEESYDPAVLAEKLLAQHSADLANLDFVAVEGWRLTITEARVYALSALLHA